MFTPSQAFYLASLESVIGEQFVSPYCKMKLFSNNFTPLVTSVVGDFTEADFTGYDMNSLLGFPTPSLMLDGSVYSVNQAIAVFTQTAVTVSQIVYGYYVLDNAGGYVGGERFNTPMNFNAAGLSLYLALAIALGPQGYFLSATILS